MSAMRIQIDAGRESFAPLERLAGVIAWDFDQPPEKLELRLFWHTSGKGTQDVGIADSLDVVSPPPSGERRFAFGLPEGPYSFSGRLITLAWALELIAMPSRETNRVDLVVSPTGQEIRLHSVPASP